MFLSDTDECSVMNGQCEHTCRNWAGGYECLCDEGYNTKDEGITCNGKSSDVNSQ